MEEAQTVKQFNIDIAAMLPRITADVAEDLRKKAFDSFSYTATEIMKAEISSFLKSEIVPKLREELRLHEAELRAGMITALFESLKVLNEKALEHARKKLSGWEGDALVRTLTETIFGKAKEIA